MTRVNERLEQPQKNGVGWLVGFGRCFLLFFFFPCPFGGIFAFHASFRGCIFGEVKMVLLEAF